MLTRELLAKIRKIEIRTRRIVDEITGGAYHSVFKGRGIEFSEVREYIPGDDVRDIDWNVTARTNAAHVKKFAEERELTVMLAVDVSRSCAFGSGPVQKREKMAEAAALLALSAVRNHDKAGLLLFSDRRELYLPPRSGRTHVLRLIRELLACESKGQGTDIASGVESVSRALKKKAVVFLISDFEDERDFDRPLRMLACRHDVVMVRVTDPLENALPSLPGLQLVDSETGARMTFDASSARLRGRYAQAAAYLTEKFENTARAAAVDTIELTPEEDLVRPLMKFFRNRAERTFPRFRQSAS